MRRETEEQMLEKYGVEYFDKMNPNFWQKKY